MKTLTKSLIFASLIFIMFIFYGCAGAYVGVGVHAPGPWAGPYGGGPGTTVVIGRPAPSGYYPFHPDKGRIIGASDEIHQTQFEQPALID